MLPFLRGALRIGVRVGLVVGAALAVFKVVQSRRPEPQPYAPGGPPVDTVPPAPSAEPEVPRPTTVESVEVGTRDRAAGAPAADRSPADPWVDPDDGICPASHPVKAKLTSGIYHLAGMAAYERTRADRCYCDEETAQADGLRRAKR